MIPGPNFFSRSLRKRLSQRGVSLVEALLALVVMSLGMLAVVGVQTTLRSNADLSRQRGEAVRLAQEGLETWRNFVSMQAVGANDYTDIVTDAAAVDVTPAGANATYRLTRQVTVSGSPPVRTVGVTVAWTDRGGIAQQVNLFSTIAGVAPEMAISLAVPANGTPARQPGGRHVNIPRAALDRGDGTSSFTLPPSASGNRLAVVFNNYSGLINSICTTDPSAVTTCVNDLALLLSGFIRMALPATYSSPLTISDTQVLDPQSTFGDLTSFLATRSIALEVVYYSSVYEEFVRTADCFYDLSLPASSTAVEYFCILRLHTAYAVPAPSWRGRLRFTSPDTVWAETREETSTTLLRACRYKPNPASHVRVTGPLSNQNLLLIQAGTGAVANVCPASATAPHQPDS